MEMSQGGQSMSKFGVGVGDEFPVDDGSGPGAGGDQGPDDRAQYEAWKRRKEAYRAQREQWRAQREEWRSRKHAFKEKVRAAARESFGDDWDERRYGRRGYGYGRRGFGLSLFALIPLLGLVLMVALIAAIIKSPFVFLALALGGFFLFAYRHHRHDHNFAGHGWHGPDRDGRSYDFDLKPSRAPQAPKDNNADYNNVIVTPPPSQTPPQSPQDGGK
jgi:hypothetical protein